MKTIIFTLLTILLISCNVTETETITVEAKNDYQFVNYLYIDNYGGDSLFCNVMFSKLPQRMQYASHNIGCDSMIFDKDSMTVEIYREDQEVYIHNMSQNDCIGYVSY